jgi:predicted DNA-binding protein YlxM (UPF0122 family)
MKKFDQAMLYHLYVEEQLTIRMIAKRFEVTSSMVYDAMRRWRIPRRSHSFRIQRSKPSIPLDEFELRHRYDDLQLTMKEIAEQLDVSAAVVLSAMKFWNIPRRQGRPKSKR